MPLLIIPDMMKYQYSLACLTDSGRFCNNVAAEAAYVLDPGSNDPVTGISIAQPNSTAGEIPNPCDLCFIKNLRLQAGSPYYDGPALADSSVYESKTSSCSITGMPLTTTDLLWYTVTTTTTAPPTSTCAGSAYTIQSGDTCHTISKTQGISTAWLLMDNNLQAFCNEFPTSGTLCLANKCPVYTVLATDTCSSIATAYNVTEPQLKAWNPVINAGCYNMNKLVGTELCVGSPGKTYTTPTVTLVQPTTATTPAPVPTDVADLTSTYCGKYYMAVTGDYCNLIVLRFSISMPDFVFLNPAINVNCTNLFADESYCVQPVGDSYLILSCVPRSPHFISSWLDSGLTNYTVNTYPGKAGASHPVTGAQTTIPFSALPDVTPTTTTGGSISTPSPIATGTRRDSNDYFLGDSFPSLPPRDGAVSDCTEFENFYDDASTCADFLNAWHLTIAQFFAYNPEVNADCSGLWPAYQYCVRAPRYVDTFPSTATGTGTTTTTPTTPPTGVVTPTPIQDGVISTCNKFAKAASGEYCLLFAGNNGITAAQLYLWNTVLGSNGQNCDSLFWADEYYCVGVSGTSPPATTTSTPVQTPSPIQDGMVANCNKFALVPAGSYCSLFADNNSITTAQLYT
ncbi:hypothetical protein VE01_05175 [Pseudogymnoascus verrucosus]|uniref:LysM domain-containing protein n=1 Tax=Pseudogymnoascus verrucosus TaxID=342668 RepID=A0A1B8GIA4_9PEZI|nr:uncharacterized protein VE01_05175 [Pseudogymnoascus verrucosus]OBT95526.2 hypothetical protein VE01_05175 [Pseudogymnoascus verrucosus]